MNTGETLLLCLGVDYLASPDDLRSPDSVCHFLYGIRQTELEGQ